MGYSIENRLVNELAKKWELEEKQVVKELTIPIIHQIYYDNYLEGRDYVRIDLAAYDKKNDIIIFVEAENGLFLQHPQIYLPFCNHLYVLCPKDNSSFRDEQFNWSKEQGIGIIEKSHNGDFDISLEPKNRKIYPGVQAFVKSRLFKRVEKEMKKNVKHSK
jgi:hypothetical protein